MAKSLKKRDKKKKKKLTDKQILKLLKALKPQTQQIVRVNVGDKGDKKKKPGEVQSLYNPPFVFPSQPQPAIINLGQAPAPYAPIAQPQKALEAPSQREKDLEELKQRQFDLEYQTQQFIMKQQKAQRAFESPYMPIESEAEAELIVRPKRKYNKKEKPTAVVTFSESEFEPEPRFNIRKTKTSQLAADSSFTRNAYYSGDINTPSQNDKFLPAVIETNAGADQMGNAAAPLSSEEFMFTPEGEVPLEVQQTEMAAEPTVEPAAASVELQPADVFQEENPDIFSFDVLPPIPVEEKPVLKAPAELPPVKTTKPRTEPLEAITKPMLKIAPNISINVMRGQINDAIIDDGYDGVPLEYRSKRASAKGQLKSGIKIDDLRKLYEDYLKS